MYDIVSGPKYPAAGEIPFAFWNLTRAARVNPPNFDVSFPGDPAPVFEMTNPWVFKYC